MIACLVRDLSSSRVEGAALKSDSTPSSTDTSPGLRSQAILAAVIFDDAEKFCNFSTLIRAIYDATPSCWEHTSMCVRNELHVWSAVLTSASLKMAVFWDVVPCTLVEVNYVSEVIASTTRN
jgi:hypothetical protein